MRGLEKLRPAKSLSETVDWRQMMKFWFLSPLALIAGTLPALAITVQAPVNGAQVTSPFTLAASATTCASKQAVSMGYSIDQGPTTIEPPSFNALIVAAEGPHTVSVKCWGHGVHEHQIVNFTVVSGNPPPAVTATPTFTPASGAFNSAQAVTLASATAGAVIYYTTDGTIPAASSDVYSGAIAVSASVVIRAIAIGPTEAASALAIGSYLISPEGTGPTVPPDAIVETQIHLLPHWKHNHDPGTPGNSVGTMALVGDPSLSGTAAQFSGSYTNGGGEIYSKSYAIDTEATNFLYDTYVWIESGSRIANLELDNNQVLSNGDTVIYGVQCAGDDHVWDYTGNTGTKKAPRVHWIRSSAPCNPAEWTTNVWHHVQIGYSRDDLGNVTYGSLWLDGVEAVINETVPSAFALGWRHGDLLTNFQVDGFPHSSGSTVLYVDNLTISRW
jgi:hypothetical protein